MDQTDLYILTVNIIHEFTEKFKNQQLKLILMLLQDIGPLD